jgi:hypothetical protein
LKVGKQLIRYRTPIKGSQEQDLVLLNPTWPRSEALQGRTVRAFVLDNFLAHGKALPVSAMSKLNNTEKLFLHVVKGFGFLT